MRSILSLQFLGPYLPHTTCFTDTREDSAPPWRCSWCLGDGAVRERLYLGLWCVGVFYFILQIKHIHNNQQTKQNFMDAPVEGLKKIMSHFRSVAPNFFTAETPLRNWVETCAFLFSPSIPAFCPEPVSFHSPKPLRMSPPTPYQEAARPSFCCQWVFGSSITPEAELIFLCDLAEVPGLRAVRQPHLSCSSP